MTKKKEISIANKYFVPSRMMFISLLKKVMIASINLQSTPANERGRLPIMLKKMGLTGEGVEVGVLRGNFSEKILKNSSLSRLYSIDPWIKFKKSEYKDYANISQHHHDNNYLVSFLRLMKFGKRSVCLRMTSNDAQMLFKGGQLDFVYIDANHSYENCTEDLNIWWPKIKKGGVFAGHDYMNTKWGNTVFEVKKAVDDFAKKNNLTVKVIKEKIESTSSWYIIK